MTADPFAPTDPFSVATSDFAKITDHIGHLVLVTPLSFESGVTTTMGESDVVTVNFVDLDETDDNGNTGVSYEDSRVFPKALVGSLKNAAKFNESNPAGNPATGLPKMVLGVIGKGEAKKGQSAPWLLLPPSADQIVRGRTFANTMKPLVAQDSPFNL